MKVYHKKETCQAKTLRFILQGVMALTIVTLIEDTPVDDIGLKTEHGLSFYLENEGHKLLFETGQSGAFLSNADRLQVDLNGLEYVVLSHGHYDHTGGLRALTEQYGGFELVVGKGFFKEKYSLHETVHTFKGNNFNKEFLVHNNVPIRFVKDSLLEILPHVYAVTGFPAGYRDEGRNPRYQLLENNRFVEDPFTDEILLVIDTPKGLVVLVGCSHPGIRNMLDAVQAHFDKPVYALLGGIHLLEAPKERISGTAEYFGELPLKYLGVCHCTGSAAGEVLHRTNSAYYSNKTGSSLVV